MGPRVEGGYRATAQSECYWGLSNFLTLLFLLSFSRNCKNKKSPSDSISIWGLTGVFALSVIWQFDVLSSGYSIFYLLAIFSRKKKSVGSRKIFLRNSETWEVLKPDQIWEGRGWCHLNTTQPLLSSPVKAYKSSSISCCLRIIKDGMEDIDIVKLFCMNKHVRSDFPDFEGSSGNINCVDFTRKK